MGKNGLIRVGQNGPEFSGYEDNLGAYNEKQYIGAAVEKAVATALADLKRENKRENRNVNVPTKVYEEKRNVIQMPKSGGTVEGRTDIPVMNARMELGNISDMIAQKTTLTEIDNEIDGASDKLIANDASVRGTIFTASVPRNSLWHFQPNTLGEGNRNLPSFMLVLKDASGDFLSGNYQIMGWNRNRNKPRGVIAAGALMKFGTGTTTSADLTWYDKKVFYDNDIWMGDSDVIDIYVVSATELDVDESSLALEFTEWTP